MSQGQEQVENARIDDVAELDQISASFLVTSVYDVSNDGANIALSARVVSPFVKDYDATGERPSQIAAVFDVTRWGYIRATSRGELIGGAVVAFNTPGVDMLEGRPDLAVLWDIRVAPEHRRTGVGRRLFETAEQWARARSCVELKVETQNINVPACRFYARNGCVLKGASPHAYEIHPDEMQLLWLKSIIDSPRAGTTLRKDQT